MTNYVDHGYGWACSDCIMYVANGETPPEMSEDETTAWLDGINKRLGDVHVGYGGAHDDDCPNMHDGQWVGDTDCYCEQQEFSWSPCDVCGSNLGGSRDAVHFFAVSA